MAVNNINASSSTTGFKTCTAVISNLTANQAKMLLVENTNRTYTLIQNLSSVSVTVALGAVGTAALNKGIILLPFGSYEITNDNLYVGTISAISASNADLSLVECIKS
jgi:hypothetical protein